jgi:hypothetical protein
MIRALEHPNPYKLSNFAQIEIPVSFRIVDESRSHWPTERLSTLSARNGEIFDSRRLLLHSWGLFARPRKKFMIATKYKTRLKHKQKCSDGAMAFYFEKPAGFELQPGQYVDVTLINPPETDPQAPRPNLLPGGTSPTG